MRENRPARRRRNVASPTGRGMHGYRAGGARAAPGPVNCRGVGPYRPSTLLLTMTFTATRRFIALPSSVSLGASGSAVAIPVGVSMR